ncbi:MAG: hypothetical protein HQK49_07555 [Oligoflexia bacterium]|nr:hypothetical protein [Oligoflexia bacterium]
MFTKTIEEKFNKIFIPYFDKRDLINYPKAWSILVTYLILLCTEVSAAIVFLFTNPSFFKAPHVIVSYLVCTSFALLSLYLLKQNNLKLAINLTVIFLITMIVAGLASKMSIKGSTYFSINVLYALTAISLISMFSTKRHIQFVTIIYLISFIVYYIHMKNLFSPLYKDSAQITLVMGLALIIIVTSISHFVMYSRDHINMKISNEITRNHKLTIKLNNSFKQRASELKSIKAKYLQVNNEISTADKDICEILRINNEYEQKSNEIANTIMVQTKEGESIINKLDDAFKLIKGTNLRLMQIIDIFIKMNSRISIINDIAFETKILAFNASIEAARAGGQEEKGFKVVSKEVENLANKSNDVAKEISEIIEESKHQIIKIIENISSHSNHTEKISKISKEKYIQLSQEINLLCQQIALINMNNQKLEQNIKHHFKAMKVS